MNAFTPEQEALIAQKQTFIAQKEELLTQYKRYAPDLAYAGNDFDKSLIVSKRQKLAAKVKALAEKIREIEALEAQV